MPVTASGPLSLPFAGLAELIAACPTFRTVVNAVSTAEALPFVFYPELDQDDEDNPPPANYAILCHTDNCEWQMAPSLGQRGSLEWALVIEADADLNPGSGDALLTFLNLAGAIVDEALRLANTVIPGSSTGATYWNLIDVQVLIAPRLADPRKKTVTDGVADTNQFEIGFLAAYL